MESDLLNNLRGISTILVMIAFFGVCWWAFSPSRRAKFNEAANLPFADAMENKQSESSLNSLNNAGEPDTGDKGQEKS